MIATSLDLETYRVEQAQLGQLPLVRRHVRNDPRYLPCVHGEELVRPLLQGVHQVGRTRELRASCRVLVHLVVHQVQHPIQAVAE